MFQAPATVASKQYRHVLQGSSSKAHRVLQALSSLRTPLTHGAAQWRTGCVQRSGVAAQGCPRTTSAGATGAQGMAAGGPSTCSSPLWARAPRSSSGWGQAAASCAPGSAPAGPGPAASAHCAACSPSRRLMTAQIPLQAGILRSEQCLGQVVGASCATCSPS